MPIVPKYVQIYNKILNKIENAEYSHKIPSENQLTQDFNCSRVTIRSALALLKEDKVIYRVKVTLLIAINLPVLPVLRLIVHSSPVVVMLQLIRTISQ